jgi:hypothetical protein
MMHKLLCAIDDAWWWCYRTLDRVQEFLSCILKPRYWKLWIVRPKTLRIGYNSRQAVYLHTAMAVLCDFYHREITRGETDWQWDVSYTDAWETIREIATWWEEEYPTYEAIWDLPDHLQCTNGTPDMGAAYNEWIKSLGEQELAQEAKTKEMLVKLAEVSPFLA